MPKGRRSGVRLSGRVPSVNYLGGCFVAYSKVRRVKQWKVDSFDSRVISGLIRFGGESVRVYLVSRFNDRCLEDHYVGDASCWSAAVRLIHAAGARVERQRGWVRFGFDDDGERSMWVTIWGGAIFLRELVASSKSSVRVGSLGVSVSI